MSLVSHGGNITHVPNVQGPSQKLMGPFIVFQLEGGPSRDNLCLHLFDGKLVSSEYWYTILRKLKTFEILFPAKIDSGGFQICRSHAHLVPGFLKDLSCF